MFFQKNVLVNLHIKLKGSKEYKSKLVCILPSHTTSTPAWDKNVKKFDDTHASDLLELVKSSYIEVVHVSIKHSMLTLKRGVQRISDRL